MMSLPPPIAFGFDPKFADWRDDQLQAIDKIIAPREGVRASGLVMPTGSGKSLANVAGAILYGDTSNLTLLDAKPRALILTTNKALEDQYARDFTSVGLVDIRGMNSYLCLEPYPDQRGCSCEDGPCRFGHNCVLQEGGCTYYDALRAAQRSQIVVTNYAYALAAYNYGQGLGQFDVMFLDEAHDAAEQLSKFLSVTVSENDARKLGTKFPDTDDLDVWGAWAKDWFANASRRLEVMPPAHTRTQVFEYRHMKRIASVFQRLTRVCNMDWIVDRTKTGEATFDIIAPGLYKEVLFRGTKRLVLTSATLRRKTLRLLGLNDGEADLWECPSRFPIARRPIIYVKGNAIKIRVDHRMTAGIKSLWISNIDEIIGQRLDRKGIVHSVSYARAEDIYKNSIYKEFMILDDRRTSSITAVQNFLNRPAPCVIVSPALMTGWDFPDDDCRYQIVAKMPIPDSRVPIVKARQDRDKEYGPYITTQQLVQACGRGMRSESDWCETFIIDDNWEWMKSRYKSLIPRWFFQALRDEYAFPAPINF